MDRIIRLVVTSIVAAIFALPALAQDTTATPRDSWSSAFTVGIPGIGMQSLPAPFVVTGAHFTDLNPSKLSGDLAIGVAPAMFLMGGMILEARGGVALPMQMTPTSFLVPSAGGTLLTFLGPDAGLALPGGNMGLSLLLTNPDGSGVRFGVTWHRLAGLEESVWLAEFGFLSRKSKR